MIGRIASVGLLAASIATLQARAQQQVPAAPPQEPAASSTQQPAAPAPNAAPTFPAIDPKNFTAAAPTKDEVNAFLQASWGYDENRVWEVGAILKTPVEGLSKVIIYMGDKTGKEKSSGFLFWALPDGKHIIAGDDVYPFGTNPYAGSRAVLQQQANGPYKGAAGKELELVEFADFECPHCKSAQANMDKLAVDFPKARIVFQNYPLERIHPESKLAAEYGVCVSKLGGSTAFFQFVNAVFDGQEGLATADGATLTLNSAVTKAGLDPAKVTACANTPATSDDVENSVKLAQDLNINQTPTLMVNGRQVPVGGLSYDMLKKIVVYQEKLDGIQQ
ncbi:MAG TPA: thioredoxin domain-containing protein [Terracidiphilus sp.]|jgi:protein-disulfide isomerase|nr:thioredoxin domain-containing protein [Terracidiphilus sp.]